MNKRNLMNNTKTRRKGSMLQDSLSKIKYLLVLAVLLVVPVLPMQAMAGLTPLVIDQTDTGADRIVAYFDTRDRSTFVQVTNTSSSLVNIHVQVWDVGSIFTTCEECNFVDALTGNDTHVYDVEDFVRNIDGETVCTELGVGTYGFVVISAFGTDSSNSNALIGMFRIIDQAGYEYRTNAAATEDVSFNDSGYEKIVNFSDANGNTLSDLIGLVYVSLGDFAVQAHPGIQATFGSVNPLNEILIWDEDEDDISCSPTTFACDVGFMNKGIDNALPNSKGQQNRVCASSILNTNSSGWLDLPFSGFTCTAASGVGDADGNCVAGDPFFVGFIGLNNGDGTGSMDSWWEQDMGD